MDASTTRSLLRTWALALLLSTLLAAAGERWPHPLTPHAAAVWALLLLPTLALVLVLRAGWALPEQQGDPRGEGRGRD